MHEFKPFRLVEGDQPGTCTCTCTQTARVREQSDGSTTYTHTPLPSYLYRYRYRCKHALCTCTYFPGRSMGAGTGLYSCKVGSTRPRGLQGLERYRYRYEDTTRGALYLCMYLYSLGVEVLVQVYRYSRKHKSPRAARGGEV